MNNTEPDTNDARRKALWARQAARHTTPPPPFKPADLPHTRTPKRETMTRSAYQEWKRGKKFKPLTVAEFLDVELVEGVLNPCAEVCSARLRSR